MADVKLGAARDVGMEALSRRFRAPLRAFLAKRLPAGADVEDYVQEIFLRLARRDDLAAIDNLEGYIFQTAMNLVRDEGRRAAASGAALHIAYDELQHGREDLSPERVLLAKDTLDAVLRAVEQLPVRTRTVFLLRRFEGLRYGEIAQRMGISASAAEKHMAKAVARLDQILEGLK